MTATSGTVRFRRVSRQDPCPVCGKPDWCRVFDDGGVQCMREASPIVCRGGGWLHWPDGRAGDWRDRVFPALPAPVPRPTPTADPVLLDRAFRALLAACPLSPAHARSCTSAG